jgi:stage III sporulation protein AA
MENKGANIYDAVLENICIDLNRPLLNIPASYKEKVEEIRIRNGSFLTVYSGGKDYFVTKEGKLSTKLEEGIKIEKSHINKTFQLISNYSVYAFEEEIKNGFITIKGGHRVGIGGKVIYGNNGIETIRNISSLNIRIAREKIGVSNHIIKYLIDPPFTIHNTLIISPPQCGKTTLLRDIVRNLSDGIYLDNGKGFKIGVVDERSEIAGVYNGIPQNDIGIRTDVLDGCLKSDGIMMLIRSMSPEIIVVDEIGGKRDAEAIQEALKAGIKLIATVHGSTLDEIMSRSSMKELLNEKIFKRYIFLDRSKGVGTIKEIMDVDKSTPIYLS